MNWPSARLTYVSGHYASRPRERSMRIVTDSTSDCLTKPELPDAIRRVIGRSLRIQPRRQNGEDSHSIADAIRQSIVDFLAQKPNIAENAL